MTIEKLFCVLNDKPANMPVKILINEEYYNIIITYWRLYSISLKVSNNVEKVTTVKDLRKDLFGYRKDLSLLTKVSVEVVWEKENRDKDSKVFYEPEIEILEENEKLILKVILEEDGE